MFCKTCQLLFKTLPVSETPSQEAQFAWMSHLIGQEWQNEGQLSLYLMQIKLVHFGRIMQMCRMMKSSNSRRKHKDRERHLMCLSQLSRCFILFIYKFIFVEEKAAFSLEILFHQAEILNVQICIH